MDRISGFTFLLTWRCNFRCSYCRQRHEGGDLAPAMRARAVEWIAPRLAPGAVVNFFGGEPLLAWDSLVAVVDGLTGRGERAEPPRFSLVSNGALLDEERIDFLERHRFSLRLSFDGPAQEENRRRGSRRGIEEVMRRLALRRGIDTTIQSVIPPGRVAELADTLTAIADLAPLPVSFVPDSSVPWSESALAELARQRERLKACRGRWSDRNPSPFLDPPVREATGTFVCAAGLDRLALAPDGTLWGCHRFAVLAAANPENLALASYCLGEVPAPGEPLVRDPRIPYAPFFQRRYRRGGSYCSLCPDVVRCRTCPIDNAEAGGDLLRVPEWFCGLNRICHPSFPVV